MFQINNLNLIYDNRSNFKNTTFSNYKKNQVLKQLEKTLFNGQVESSCHWSCELVISGFILEAFEILTVLYCKFINISNPNLLKLISESLKLINKVSEHPEYSKNIISLRNNQLIRDTICKLAFCISICPKTSNTLNLVEISTQDFDHSVLKSKLLTEKNYLSSFAKPNDPNELIIAGNQLVFSILNKNIKDCIYWISWIYQWEKLNTREKKKICCHKREFTGIDIKNNDELIWFIWDIFINLSKDNNIQMSIKSLLYLFSFEYNKTKKISRISLVINCLLLLVNNIDFQISITSDIDKLNIAVENINMLYKEINLKYLKSCQTNTNYNDINSDIFIQKSSENNNLIITNSTNNNEKNKKKEQFSEEYYNSIQKLNKVEQLFNNYLL